MSDYEPRQLVFTETREIKHPEPDTLAHEMWMLMLDAVRDVEECVALVKSYSVPDGERTVRISVEQKMKPKEASDG